MKKEELVKALSQDTDPAPFFAEADRVRREEMGDGVHLRGLIEFSNHCRRRCYYCGIRAGNAKVRRYRLTPAQILDCARTAARLDYKTIVMQSGEDNHWGPRQLADIVAEVKRETGLAITLSVGEHTKEDYKLLRAAGADRFLLRFETSDRRLFSMLKPDSDYDNRFRCLAWLKEAGFQVGSGVMAGLPGQTLESMADDILLFRQLELDMVGIGPFIANPDTPMAGAVGGTLDLGLRMVALTRIVTRNTHIPATTAMGSIDPQGRQKALRCGANVLMPNISPKEHRVDYSLYPGKICTNEAPEQCAGCVDAMLVSLGRRRASGYGHTLKSIEASPR
ncbi:MAG: [FeFe] hydrogenase H-cluster radical SAM maturase HydE [Elusimicrobia bacterium GWA2_64_40]|nr:MAG: [FeFe] hydrogenase H-cluster radical SAM maturase HydE [Elusimicrobia bacterium GWA2_64_40]OGR64620.1 MAG: [FeFe] hydrogenase H-cluster radical SAM maturase HydE [Elusimicrobia bacterium GWB2_63_16]HAN04403.1 [FeFe] hydrogenase H-cluster radical SAM maturase HydE [Elusimicrobiota bacterium]